MVLTYNVRVANQAIQKVSGPSLRRTSTISGPSHSLLRTAYVTVWQLEHAPYADVFALASGWGGIRGSDFKQT